MRLPATNCRNRLVRPSSATRRPIRVDATYLQPGLRNGWLPRVAPLLRRTAYAGENDGQETTAEVLLASTSANGAGDALNSNVLLSEDVGPVTPEGGNDGGKKEELPEDYVDDNWWIPHRWRVTFMIALAFILCNMDKVNMSVAVIPMAEDLGWSATSRGIVQSAFFFGYTVTQIPAGWISTKIGGAVVLLSGVALWSFGTLIAPLAAHMGFWLLCASRALVGLGEGFAPSAATNVMASQVPGTERARAVATVFGGLDMGSAIGLLICGPLIRMYGWPCVFYLFALLGLFWCVGWPFVRPEKRDAKMWRYQQAKLAAAAKKDQNGAQNGSQNAAADVNAQSTAAEKVPWGEFFKSVPVWAIITAHFCFNWGYYTLLSWLPSFFQLALKLDVQNSSFLTVIPYIAMTLMTPLVGPAADSLVGGGMRTTNVRKIFQGMSFLGSAICMIACGILTPATTAGLTAGRVSLIVGLLSMSFAVATCARAGLYCNHQDLSPRYASALLGISNTAGALPGILGVWSVGVLLDMTGSWSTAMFYPIAATQLFGLLIYTAFASSKKQAWS
ncbi:hypothetical protein BSKO_12885 [Bryopsis sp. KO-2023]|nr:hypothetical protein BSKO_12885 [Bryopsis sp. KO-2023]